MNCPSLPGLGNSSPRGSRFCFRLNHRFQLRLTPRFPGFVANHVARTADSRGSRRTPVDLHSLLTRPHEQLLTPPYLLTRIPRCRDRDPAASSTVKPTAQLEGSEHRWEPRTNHYSPQTHKWTHKRDAWVMDISARRCQGRSPLAVVQRNSLLFYGVGLPDVHTGNGARNDEALDLTGPFEDRVGIGVADEVPGQSFFPNWADPRITGMDPFNTCSGRFRT